MTVYIRRFTEDPGLDVLLDIESVNIIDLEPPEAFAGVGTGTAILVGEFENGPFNTPTEVFGPSDLVSTFGEFGYAYDGVKGNNPCARSHKADGAIVPDANAGRRPPRRRRSGRGGRRISPSPWRQRKVTAGNF
jgi:hypothetical protein